MDGLINRETTLKELPTRELKLKRHKIRRDSPTIPPVRLRLKSNSSPLNYDGDIERCFSDRSVSSSPDSVSQELSPVFMPYKVSSLVISSPSPPNETFNFTPPSSFDEQNYDQPLDMSRKRPQVASPELQNSKQQLRPSVITCASALLRTQCNLSDLAHKMCTANMCDSNGNSNSNDNFEDYSVNQRKKSIDKNSESNDIAFGHRREVVSGSCDPVIDEHFRRSLGKDYQQIFAKPSNNNVSVTVDDHFAKALGETWHQIQQSKSVDSVPTSHSATSLQAQKHPRYIHQPPEILS